MNYKEIVKTTSNLLIICLCVGAFLALANQITKEPIKAQEMKATLENRQKLLPADEYVDLFTDEKGRLDDDLIKTLKDKKVLSIVKAVKDGAFCGFVIETGKTGYSSVIKTMYGVNPKYQIVSILVKEQAETPGLGDKIMKEPFIGQFKNKTVNQLILTKTDDENIKAITGATISSRAMTESVHDSLESVIAAIKEQATRKRGTSNQQEIPAPNVLSDNRPAAGDEKSAKQPEIEQNTDITPSVPSVPENAKASESVQPAPQETPTVNNLIIRPEDHNQTKPDAPAPVQINFNPFGSEVYAAGIQPAPALKQMLPAKAYEQVIPEGFKAIDGKGKTIGYVVKTSGKGYGGDVVVGYSTDTSFRIVAIRVLKHNETPGYGDKLETTDFLKQFRGKGADSVVLKKNPTKSDDYISAISHATISSSAVVESVRISLAKLQKAVK